ELEACFNLIDRTSSADYAASAMGWRPAAKRAELREPDMRYLLVRRQEPDRAIDSSHGLTARDAEKTTGDTGTTAGPTNPFLAKDTTILGFMSFMITIEEGQDVVYVYEIHLEEELRGLGLGKHLFNIVENIGTTSGMEKTMLTVFRRNEQARAMYGKLGYDVDECSPRPRRLRGGVVKGVDYIIMSKALQ
ncbi:acyl-CoA N-acyltransferase, partial [Delphinella strobiligena]